jgi:DNA-binding GntR family transcriptional regulator
MQVELGGGPLHVAAIVEGDLERRRRRTPHLVRCLASVDSSGCISATCGGLRANAGRIADESPPPLAGFLVGRLSLTCGCMTGTASAAVVASRSALQRGVDVCTLCIHHVYMTALTPPRSRESLADTAYRELRDAIVSGIYPPGSRLLEPQLARDLKLSRTPLREALSRLQHEGFIEGEQGLGRYVARISQAEVSDLVGIREVLEGYAARLAGEWIKPSELETLEEAHLSAATAMREQDIDLLTKSSAVFHETIIRGSHSKQCISMAKMMTLQLDRFRAFAENWTDDATRMRSHEQHGELLSALIAHDGNRAEQLMKEHVRTVGECLIASVSP